MRVFLKIGGTAASRLISVRLPFQAPHLWSSFWLTLGGLSDTPTTKPAKHLKRPKNRTIRWEPEPPSASCFAPSPHFPFPSPRLFHRRIRISELRGPRPPERYQATPAHTMARPATISLFSTSIVRARSLFGAVPDFVDGVLRVSMKSSRNFLPGAESNFWSGCLLPSAEASWKNKKYVQ